MVERSADNNCSQAERMYSMCFPMPMSKEKSKVMPISLPNRCGIAAR